jgi:hypothetical protein
VEQTAGVEELLRTWRKIPRHIEKTVRGLSRGQLEARKQDGMMSIHETVHHIAEANIVAASMIIAAIGKDCATYDWTWLYPNLDWVERLGYAHAPIKPVIKMLDGMNEHVANLVRANPKVLQCKVTLFDKPRGKKYTMTVSAIISHEVSHALDHLKEVKLDD